MCFVEALGNWVLQMKLGISFLEADENWILEMTVFGYLWKPLFFVRKLSWQYRYARNMSVLNKNPVQARNMCMEVNFFTLKSSLILLILQQMSGHQDVKPDL